MEVFNGTQKVGEGDRGETEDRGSLVTVRKTVISDQTLKILKYI